MDHKPFCCFVIPILALAALAVGGCAEETPADRDPVAELTPLQVPATAGSLAPNLTSGAGGALVLSWVEPAGDRHRLRYAVLTDTEWSEPRTVAAGDDWFVNWADFPSVVPLSDSLWAAHWLVSQPAGGYAYDVMIALSRDGGSSWSAPIRPHDDGTPTEHGFVTLFPQEGGLGVIWLDGRNMAQQVGGDHVSHDMNSKRGMTLRAATLGPNLRVGNEAVIDPLTCDCCQTDAAKTSTGMLAVYRNRTANEIRDIYAARWVNGQWQPGRPVANDGWKIAGCPVNGPVVEADGSRVVVAWFTAAGNQPLVKIARSNNAGVTFSTPVEVVTKHVSGHVGLALLPDQSVAVSWTCQRTNGHTGVCLRTISGSGALGPVRVLSGDTQVPPRSVPQLERRGEALIAAWTQTTADGRTTIASARVPIAALR